MSDTGLSNICNRPASSASSGTLIVITLLLLRERFLARVLGQSAGVLEASLLFVAGDYVERGLGHGLLHHILAGDLHLAIMLHAGAGRDEAAHDDVLLETA